MVSWLRIVFSQLLHMYNGAHPSMAFWDPGNCPLGPTATSFFCVSLFQKSPTYWQYLTYLRLCCLGNMGPGDWEAKWAQIKEVVPGILFLGWEEQRSLSCGHCPPQNLMFRSEFGDVSFKPVMNSFFDESKLRLCPFSIPTVPNSIIEK